MLHHATTATIKSNKGINYDYFFRGGAILKLIGIDFFLQFLSVSLCQHGVGTVSMVGPTSYHVLRDSFIHTSTLFFLFLSKSRFMWLSAAKNEVILLVGRPKRR